MSKTERFSLVVAVLSLCGTLIFNAITLVRSEHETRKARIASEVALLTQVGASANQAAEDLIASGANRKRCLKAPRFSLSQPQDARLNAALINYDYLAWLINKGQVSLASAKRYWGRDMIDVYNLGREFDDPAGVKLLYQELHDFAHTASAKLQPPDPCVPSKRQG